MAFYLTDIGQCFRSAQTLPSRKNQKSGRVRINYNLNIEFSLFFHGFRILYYSKNKFSAYNLRNSLKYSKNFQIQSKKQKEVNKNNNFKHRQLCDNIASVG